MLMDHPKPRRPPPQQSVIGPPRRPGGARRRAALGLVLWAGLALLLAGIGSGCARPPKGPAFEWAPPPPENRGRVYIFRAEPLANLSTVRVEIDGRSVGDFEPGEYETLELAAGSHRLAAGMRGFALLSWGWNEHRFSLDPGQTLFLEISVRLDQTNESNMPPPGGLEIGGRPERQARKNVFIRRTPRPEAQEVLPSTKRLEP